ncbi:MAG: hypothetical protein Q4D51_01985 [Eubacteriales bacterium]|nr:hypothetical protein [Eubacteriales bacterium]
MKDNKTIEVPKDQPGATKFANGNIPKDQLPQGVISDDRPRKDGPGGDSGK